MAAACVRGHTHARPLDRAGVGVRNRHDDMTCANIGRVRVGGTSACKQGGDARACVICSHRHFLRLACHVVEHIHVKLYVGVQLAPVLRRNT